MRCIIFVAAFVLGAGASAHAASSFPFLNSTVKIVDSAEGASVLSKDVNYPAKFSLFDVQARLGTNATSRDYIPTAMHHTQNWDITEEDQLRTAFANIESYVTEQGVKLDLPSTIYLVKSDTKQEFGAEGYTMGNAIVLNPAVEPVTTGVAAHELFHVFSRFNEKKRDDLYSVFGFKRCNPIELNTAIANRNITNPDCPVVSHYLSVDGEDMTLLLYANNDYTGGSVFQEYIKIGALVLQGDDAHKKAKMVNGKAVIKELQDVPDIFKQVGTNTDYMLHPEEICAEHFAMMIIGKTPRQPELLEKFKDKLVY